jgi:hypothetical protein
MIVRGPEVGDHMSLIFQVATEKNMVTHFQAAPGQGWKQGGMYSSDSPRSTEGLWGIK